MNCGSTNEFDDPCAGGCPDGRYVRFGTGELFPPLPAARGYTYFSLRGASVQANEYLTPEYVSGTRVPCENGGISLLPGSTVAFYGFGGHTPNGVESVAVTPVAVTPVADGADLAYGSANAARLPSGRLAGCAGVFALGGAGNLAFRIDSLPVVQVDDISFDLLLLYLP